MWAGDLPLLLGSSRAYDPSSFFFIRYTRNITSRTAHNKPTTAPPIIAASKPGCPKKDDLKAELGGSESFGGFSESFNVCILNLATAERFQRKI